jgi:hypothetical protein
LEAHVKVFILTAAYALSLFGATASLGRPAKSDGSSVEKIEFDVLRGKTLNEFTYSVSGDLLYKHKPFVPAVTGTKDMARFNISIGPNHSLAAAIGKDVDGQDTLYLLKLNVHAAISFQQGSAKWVAPIRTFWSPSGKYLVALCAYEGQRFVRAEIKTGAIAEGEFLSPGDRKRTWWVQNDPRWNGGTDVLYFTVNEGCNPFEDACGQDAVNSGKVLRTHSIALDAETLAVRLRGK